VELGEGKALQTVDRPLWTVVEFFCTTVYRLHPRAHHLSSTHSPLHTPGVPLELIAKHSAEGCPLRPPTIHLALLEKLAVSELRDTHPADGAIY